MRGADVDELRGVDGEDLVGLVRVADFDELRDFLDLGAQDHEATYDESLGQAIGDGVPGFPVHDLDFGLRGVGHAVREAGCFLGLEVGQGEPGKGYGGVHLCTRGERGVITGVFGWSSGVVLARWIG